MGEQPMTVAVDGLHKTYRTKRPRDTFLRRLLPDLNAETTEVVAIEDLTFDIRAGEFVSIVGPSGCGKTTALRIMDALVPSDGGRVLIN